MAITVSPSRFLGHPYLTRLQGESSQCITNLGLPCLCFKSSNDVLGFEVETSGTQFIAGAATRSAVEVLFDADRWMIYRNTLTGVNHWDFVSSIERAFLRS